MPRRTLLAMWLLLPPVCATAADKTGMYQNLSIGTLSCGAFIKELRDPTWENSAEMWLSGYLTGVNYVLDDTNSILGTTDIFGAMGWVKHYCVSHSTDFVSKAAASFVIFAYPTRSRAGPRN
jgi:hypothetical protein